MKQSKLNLPDLEFTLTPSPGAPKKRARKSKKAVWVDEKIKGNTKGLQLELFAYKGQQLTIGELEQ